MKRFSRAARMRRHHRRHKRSVRLNLVSLMDIFTILVFFLLVNSGEVEDLPNPRDVHLPESSARERAAESLVVTVTPEDILVQGRRVAGVAAVSESAEATVPELADALRARIGADQTAEGRRVTIMGDRGTPYRVLRKVLATCTDADYETLALAVLQKPPAGAGEGS